MILGHDLESGETLDHPGCDRLQESTPANRAIVSTINAQQMALPRTEIRTFIHGCERFVAAPPRKAHGLHEVIFLRAFGSTGDEKVQVRITGLWSG
ncbi:MAG TPA: hypothetical protein DEP82_13780 [Arthrobacter bacterium]|jgi:hypothetical protein|nr:hypothetical protein [Arthrobacter sp.]HCB58951.1 hypothetical protein [Arthrobacter sp.]HCC39713.1 hypothetical protein [Arthrobacter sp.]